MASPTTRPPVERERRTPHPSWLERFSRLPFPEYYEKWRRRLREARETLLPSSEAPADAHTFETLAFYTGGGMQLALRLFTPVTLAIWIASFFWDWHGLLRTCSVAALIGFGTNWIAVKMLFRPVQPRPVFGQGLIPQQRQEILKKVADEICGKLVNETKIRQEIEERQLVSRLTGEALERFREIARHPEFIADSRAMVLTFVGQLVESDEFRDRVARAAEERMREVTGQSLAAWLADKLREFWIGPLHRIVDRELDVLPATVDRVLSEFENVLDRVPLVLDRRRELIEGTLSRIVMAFVKEVDLRAMLERTLDTVTPEQLETSFNEFADDKLSYITLLGGILGAIGGLIILWPLWSVLGIAALVTVLALADVLLHPLMSSRHWPRQTARPHSPSPDPPDPPPAP